MDPFGMAYARKVLLLTAAALCHALAHRTYLAMTAPKPWWLGHAASLIIGAHGAGIVNRLEVSRGEYRFMLHLAAIGLGWIVNRTFSIFYATT